MQHQTTHPIQTHQLPLPARAATSARVPSDQQAERQTIGSQVSDLLARAAAEGRDIGEEFRFLDDGQRGASLVRPALERLRDLVAMAASMLSMCTPRTVWPARMPTRRSCS